MARYAIPGFGNYNFIDKDRMIMGTQEGFFNVDLSQATDSIATHKVFVTRVTANNDSVLYDRAFFARSTAPGQGALLAQLYHD